MSEWSLRELEATARAYEERLVPSLFQPWAHWLADTVELQTGHHVLDVGCGTGVLARAIAERVGLAGSVVGVDVNPGMLRVARRIAPDLEWREGSVDALPFHDASFDAVVSQFALMLFPDRPAATREMSRVLKPGGSLAIVVFDSLAENEAYEAIANTYERVVGAATADALRYPFSLGDTEELSQLVADAGLTVTTLVSETGVARFPSVRDTVLADVEGWFPLARIELSDPMIDEVVAEAGDTLGAYIGAGGVVELPVSVHAIAGRKP